MGFCHRNDILVNTRGSAPGSILCYVLEISMVDPMAAGLMFERFMSPDRDEPPDIDLDIEHQERERVIQYVYQRYGRRRAAMVANVICFRGRSAIRDVGKALGLPPAQVDRLAQRLQWHPSIEMPDPDQAGEDLPTEVSSRVGRDLLELSRQIVDFPRHLGIHTGGMIISSRPLDASVPIEPATMEGRSVAQWDKDDCADAGLLKIDLLGLGMLTLVQRAFRLIEQRHGRRLALADFRFDDPKVYDAICAADTIGMFQVESRAQMHVLPQTRPRCFYDLVVQVAIIRPGPMTTKMHRRWILRRIGLEADDPVWPGLAPVLERTLGLPIFQEQCLQIAMVAAGFSATKADALRRAMSRKRSLAHIQALQEDLLQGMARNRIPAATAEQIYAQIEGYAGYGFPEAHSCAFALLVYVSAWLKVHHHAEFSCAILNSQPMGFYSAHTLVGDAAAARGDGASRGHPAQPIRVHDRAGRWDTDRLSVRGGFGGGLPRAAGRGVRAGDVWLVGKLLPPDAVAQQRIGGAGRGGGLWQPGAEPARGPMAGADVRFGGPRGGELPGAGGRTGGTGGAAGGGCAGAGAHGLCRHRPVHALAGAGVSANDAGRGGGAAGRRPAGAGGQPISP